MRIPDNSGVQLKSEIEVNDGEIILHSRSGRDRNPDYKPAFLVLLKRLNHVGLRPDIFLDSERVHEQPLAERQVWGSSEFMPHDEMFAEVVRRMNAFPGSVSRGAWRRLLFRLPGVPAYSLTSVIMGSNPARRLGTGSLESVTRQHLERAIDKVRKGVYPHRFSPFSDYRIILEDGTHLAPKAVFAWALGEALQIFPVPDHFSGGELSTSTRILRAAGYRVEWMTGSEHAGHSKPPPAKATPAQIDAALADVPHSDDDRSWIEGDLRRANHLRRERAPGLAGRKRAAFIAIHGKLFCERCKIDPVEDYETPDAVACIEVHHYAVAVADMQPGHQTQLEDLECLCANCHRLVHRQMKANATAGS